MTACHSASAAERLSRYSWRLTRWRSWLKWFVDLAWTELNFWSVFILRNRSIARSRRWNGRWEFSARLFNQRPVSWRSAAPISFKAASVGTQAVGDDRLGPAVALHAFLMNLSAAALSRSLGDKGFQHLASWSTARHR